MKIINYLILLLPYIIILFIIYLIYNIITRKQKFRKLGISVILPILIMSIVLAFYYCPISNIFEAYNTDYINVNVKDKNVEIRDKAKMNKVLETINKYRYTKSATRSIVPETYASDYLIIISTYEYKKRKIIHLYVHNNLITKDPLPTMEHGTEKNGLEINEQMYNCNDNNGLSRDIYNLIKEFGILDN
ncbi:MAG: hypothetical protein H7Y18_07610 [Clostridiaceae bacterium]|nr:hypothetical protein [Clostridiaceae bacterium]